MVSPKPDYVIILKTDNKGILAIHEQIWSRIPTGSDAILIFAEQKKGGAPRIFRQYVVRVGRSGAGYKTRVPVLKNGRIEYETVTKYPLSSGELEDVLDEIFTDEGYLDTRKLRLVDHRAYIARGERKKAHIRVDLYKIR